jgi:cell division protein FtsL
MTPQKDQILLWGLGLVICLIAFVSLWQRDQMTRVGYDIQRMELQKEELIKVHKELLIEVESLSALDRIEEIAVKQLSMALSVSSERVYINLESKTRGGG